MTISDFIIRILFLSLPGLVGVMTYRALKGRPDNRKDWEDILEIALFSLLSYSIYGLIITFANFQGWTSTQVFISQAVFDDTTPVPWVEISFTTVIGFVLAFIASFFYTRNAINWLGRIFRVTSMFGNKDVWDFYHKNYGSEWVFVRDHKIGLVYFGHILAYSDSDKERELIIKDVDVFDNKTSEFQYKTPVIYISRSRDDLSIELPDLTGNSKSKEEETTNERPREEPSAYQNRRSPVAARPRGKGGRQPPTEKSKA